MKTLDIQTWVVLGPWPLALGSPPLPYYIVLHMLLNLNAVSWKIVYDKKTSGGFTSHQKPSHYHAYINPNRVHMLNFLWTTNYLHQLKWFLIKCNKRKLKNEDEKNKLEYGKNILFSYLVCLHIYFVLSIKIMHKCCLAYGSN